LDKECGKWGQGDKNAKRIKKSKWEINDSLLGFKGFGLLVLRKGTSEISLRRALHQTQ
jgi:hypothetical protein